MHSIETHILNPEAITSAEKMMVCTARLTQRGHSIKNMRGFLEMYEKGYTDKTAEAMVNLPHPTIQKFAVINGVVTGASRRFLAQITRHQNEVKFMSASLQYSDYSDDADFVIPYELLDNPAQQAAYLQTCKTAMQAYRQAIADGCPSDSAGYLAPQGLKNVLVISATPYQWKHMIAQRTCRRNTTETRYVMLRFWEQLHALSPTLFSPKTTGSFCMKTKCAEGKMACGKIFKADSTPTEILKADFPLLMEE